MTKKTGDAFLMHISFFRTLTAKPSEMDNMGLFHFQKNDLFRVVHSRMANSGENQEYNRIFEWVLLFQHHTHVQLCLKECKLIKARELSIIRHYTVYVVVFCLCLTFIHFVKLLVKCINTYLNREFDMSKSLDIQNLEILSRLFLPAVVRTVNISRGRKFLKPLILRYSL